GGNRKGRARTYANLLTVMLLGGLWHGAAYTYVTWGAIHGGALAVERALGTNHLRWWWMRLAWAILVQVMVLVAWTFFRSSTVAEANAILANVLGGQPGATGLDAILPRAAYAIPVLLIHARTFLHERGLVPGPSLV